MSPRQSDRRMARLLALGEQTARASEARFAGAVAQAADAAATFSHIEGLILTTSPIAQVQGVAALAGAAHLRALLIPAVEAAGARLAAAVAQREAAEARLLQDRLRARKLAELAGVARRSLLTDIGNREQDDRPPPARKGQP